MSSCRGVAERMMVARIAKTARTPIISISVKPKPREFRDFCMTRLRSVCPSRIENEPCTAVIASETAESRLNKVVLRVLVLPALLTSVREAGVGPADGLVGPCRVPEHEGAQGVRYALCRGAPLWIGWGRRAKEVRHDGGGIREPYPGGPYADLTPPVADLEHAAYVLADHLFGRQRRASSIRVA